MSRLKHTDNTTLFMRGPSPSMRMFLCLALSLVLMTLDHRQHHLESLRAALSLLVYPLQRAVQLPFSALDWTSEQLASRDDLIEDNRKLRHKQSLLQAQLQRLSVLEAENSRLRDLLESAESIPHQVLIAELMSVDTDPYRHNILVSKGSGDGTFLGQPVLDARGVVGQVVHTSPVSSTAVLITDPGHSIPVQVDRTGLRTLAVGTGNYHELELSYIPNNVDLREGDLLVTSGLGGRFPRGYPVARIVRVDPDPGRPFARVSATPTAALDRVREVLLVAPQATAGPAGDADAEAAGDEAGEPPG
jgi:rod shape-determining protein MreC